MSEFWRPLFWPTLALLGELNFNGKLVHCENVTIIFPKTNIFALIPKSYRR